VSETHYAATWLLHPDAPKIEMPKIIQYRVDRFKQESKDNKFADKKLKTQAEVASAGEKN